MRSAAGVASLFVAVILLSIASHAQNTDPNNDTGTHPYQTYDGTRENISVGSGGVSLSIPLLTLPGRKGHNYSVGLIANSQTWSSSPIWQNLNVGIVVTRTGAIAFNPHGVINPANGIQCLNGYSITDEQGGVQTFSALRSNCVITGGGPNQGQRQPGYEVLTATDDKGEGITADLNACRLTFKDGSFTPLATGTNKCPLVGTTNGISPVLETASAREPSRSNAAAPALREVGP